MQVTYLSATGAPTLVLHKTTPTDYYAEPLLSHGAVPQVLLLSHRRTHARTSPAAALLTDAAAIWRMRRRW
jgi:hypothetical protein